MSYRKYLALTTMLFMTASFCGVILGETDLGVWYDLLVIMPFAFAHSSLCTYLFGGRVAR